MKPRCSVCGVVSVSKSGDMCSDCRKQIEKGSDRLLRDLGKKK